MKELGILIDLEGNMYYFGEWMENCKDKGHTISFESDVVSLEEFKKLNLNYDKNKEIVVQSQEEYIKKGILMIFNITKNIASGLAFLMTVPSKLSSMQKERLTELYPVLSNFSDQYIYDLDDDCDKYSSLDDYFEKNDVRRAKVKLI